MSTSIRTIPPIPGTAGKAPLFLSPTDTTGNLILYKIIAETAPLIHEMEEKWGIWKSALEGPREFAAKHTHIAATYKLLWLLQKTEVTVVNAALIDQGCFPVNLVETLAFLKTYPEYTEILEKGPCATDSCVNWGFAGLGSCGPGPMSLSIHPPHSSLSSPSKWPTLGNKMMWSNSVILARTSEIAST